MDLLRLKDWCKDQKSQLKDWKSPYNDPNSRFISKKSIYIEKVNQIWPLSIKIDLKSNFYNLFTICWDRCRHDELKSNDDFWLKKLIKRQFESDLKQNLALGRLNCISLISSHETDFNRAVFGTKCFITDGRLANYIFVILFWHANFKTIKNRQKPQGVFGFCYTSDHN